MVDALTRMPDDTWRRPGVSVNASPATITGYSKPTVGEVASMPDERFTVSVNGTPTWVHYTPRGDTATVSSNGVGGTTVTVTAKSNHPGYNSLTTADVFLQQPGVWPSPEASNKTLVGNTLTFDLPVNFNGNIAVVFNDQYKDPTAASPTVSHQPYSYGHYAYQLSIGILPEETWTPTPAEVTHYFAAGQVYTGADINLFSGDTVYIEGGALVRRRIKTYDDPSPRPQNVRVGGRGINDKWTFYYDRATNGALPYGTTQSTGLQSMMFADCDHLTVEGITLVGYSGWALITADCTDVDISWLRLYACEIQDTGYKNDQGTPDGYDPIGGTDVTASNMFISACDDSSAIKCDKYMGDGNVLRFTLQDQLWLQGGNGNGCDIGYELGLYDVTTVRYRRIRIPTTWHVGGVDFRHTALGFHVLSKADVSDVLYEDIKIDYMWGKNHMNYAGTFYFESGLGSVAGTDNRGTITNLTYRRVHWPDQTTVNPNPQWEADGDIDARWIVAAVDGGPLPSQVTFEDCYEGSNAINSLWVAAQGSNWIDGTSDGITVTHSG